MWFFSTSEAPARPADAYADDPLAHPALRAMTPDQLADLPLWPIGRADRDHETPSNGARPC